MRPFADRLKANGGRMRQTGANNNRSIFIITHMVTIDLHEETADLDTALPVSVRRMPSTSYRVFTLSVRPNSPEPAPPDQANAY